MQETWIDPISAADKLESDSGDVTVRDCISTRRGFEIIIDAPYRAANAIKSLNEASPRWDDEEEMWRMDAGLLNELIQSIERNGMTIGLSAQAKAWCACYRFYDVDLPVSLPDVSMFPWEIKETCRGLSEEDELEIVLADGSATQWTVNRITENFIWLNDGYTLNLRGDRVTISKELRSNHRVVVAVKQLS